MLEFDDDINWREKRIAGVKKAYKIPKKGGIAIDIGANIGAFSIVNHNKFDKIISFEPSQNTYDICVKNTKQYGNVDVYRYAVDKESDGIAKLCGFINGNVSGNASTMVADCYDLNNYEEVPTISLERIFKMLNIPKIDYLKIDCEGGEYDFLMNKDLNNINYIGIEIHIHLGEEKMNELITHIEKTHSKYSTHGNGKTSHFEITYVNKNYNGKNLF
jgi:FkbM family methyltransferase|tara:strand:+ start:4080 stop:4730 length:651 start_codon:yes stop_codon:yes gene_type:complete